MPRHRGSGRVGSRSPDNRLPNWSLLAMHATPLVSRHTFGHSMLAHWTLDPAVTYLNHGTVGVVPRRVQEAQRAIRDEIERQPARFLVRELADVGEFVMRMPARMRTAA